MTCIVAYEIKICQFVTVLQNMGQKCLSVCILAMVDGVSQMYLWVLVQAKLGWCRCSDFVLWNFVWHGIVVVCLFFFLGINNGQLWLLWHSCGPDTDL